MHQCTRVHDVWQSKSYELGITDPLLSRCSLFHSQMPRALEVWASPHSSPRSAASNNHTMVIYNMGHGYPRTFPFSQRVSQIPYRHHWLLHQMNCTRAIGNHYCSARLYIFMKNIICKHSLPHYLVTTTITNSLTKALNSSYNNLISNIGSP